MEAAFLRLGVPSQRVHFVPLGVDDDVPVAGPALSENKFYTRFRDFPGFKRLSVGSLIPRKAVDVLIAAHGILQSRGCRVACAIVGSGPAEPALRRLGKEVGLDEIMFTGASPHMLVPHWMKAADVLVLPSRSEGRGMVLVEAMALGVPIVASDIPGPNELIHSGENGFLFPFGDSAALADRLASLIDNAQLRLEMGRAGQTLVRSEGLTAQCSARQHSLLYQDVLSTSAALDPERDPRPVE
jgi:glycosyltransferase involved in cell wall biosynthesis